MNNFRLMLLRLSFFVLLHGLFSVTGCVNAHSLTDEVNDDLPLPIVTPDKPSQLEVPSLAVSAPASTVATVHDLLGSGGTISIKRDAPHSINQSGTTIAFGTETEFTYALQENGGLFTFAKPLPIVTARVGPITVQPWLKSIKLNPDDTATATVHGSIYGDKTRTFSIKWGDDAGLADSSLPEVWYWSSDACPPCVRFERDYAEHEKDCGFKAVKQSGSRPSWMPESNPQFWWHVSSDKPTQAEVKQTRHENGYANWKDFSGKWKNSRKSAMSESARAGLAIPFEERTSRLDHSQSRAVARITYHSDHNCPSCGRQQTLIDNEDGPGSGTHTHKCHHCGTVWYHADQVSSASSRSNNTNQFMWFQWRSRGR